MLFAIMIMLSSQRYISEQKNSQVGFSVVLTSTIIIILIRLLGMATMKERREFTDVRQPISSLPQGLFGRAPYIRFFLYYHGVVDVVPKVHYGPLWILVHNSWTDGLFDYCKISTEPSWQELPEFWWQNKLSSSSKLSLPGDSQPVGGVPTISSESSSQQRWCWGEFIIQISIHMINMITFRCTAPMWTCSRLRQERSSSR